MQYSRAQWTGLNAGRQAGRQYIKEPVAAVAKGYTRKVNPHPSVKEIS